MKMQGFMKTFYVILIVSMLACYGVAFASSGGEHHDAKPKGWVSTDTYRVLNFLVLLGGLVFLLRKPVSQALGARIEGIQKQLEELEAKKVEAEKHVAECNQKLKNLEQEADQIIASYVQQGEAAKARILEEAGKMSEKLQEQASKNIDQEFKQARKVLQEEMLEKASLMAEEIIKKTITSADQERLVGEYLEKVVA